MVDHGSFDSTIQHLTLGELHALCYKLGVEYGDLRGKSREARARDLVAMMQARGRLDELARALQPEEPRPDRRAPSYQKGVRPALNRRNLVLVAAALLIAVAALVLATILAGANGQDVARWAMATDRLREEPAVLAVPETSTPTPLPLPLIPDQWAISYAAAAGWLETLPPEEHDDQILDWTLWGLAGLLELDTRTLRNAFYDQTLVRNAALADLAVHRVGPGRGLADGRGTLHVLAPAADPLASRAISLVLDDYRKDAGLDPEKVRIYRYRIDHGAQQVVLAPEELSPVGTVRHNHGYREMQIASLADLQQFLAGSQHLSCLEIRDDQLWAAGWQWPDAPAGQITAQDLTVLQRGYRRAVQGLSPEPGFSLDPGQPLTVAELLGLVAPGRYPGLTERQDELASFVADWDQASTEQERDRVVQDHPDLARDLFLDEEYFRLFQLLLRTVQGRSPYQKARYDGGLRGTEAGMTYFYTDLVAKAWRMEKGSGVPTGRVPGFVSDLQVQIPWGHCKFEDESGRLWFGLREEAISIHDARIDLGSITTRVFTLITDPVHGDREIEPSYSFGRLVWWWDRHYQAMADYEPQYHRLDQLMRWGAAIAWLVEKNVVLLPELPESEIVDDWQFGDWLAAHPELKWQFDIPFVEPHGETSEALLVLYSEPYENCGLEWTLSGGISNPRIERIVVIEEYRPDLEPEVSRAGLGQAGTTYSPATQAGTLTILDGSLQRTLNPVEDNLTRVKAVADGRKVWSLGGTKVWISETARRQIDLAFSSAPGRISQTLAVQNVVLGELSTTTEGAKADVRWQAGALDQAQRFLAALQDALPGRSLLEAIAATDQAPRIHTEPTGGRVLVQLCAAADPCWFAIENGLRKAGDTLAFRLGVPSASAEPVWYTVYASPPPE